ncbi:MAG: hypothetical protein WBP45_07370 [Daejeonella sp.]
MIRFKSFLVFGMIALSLKVYAQNKGAETPKALLLQSAQAMEKLDYDKIKSLYYVINEEDKKGLNALISILKISPDIREFLKKGEGKFGSDFTEALSYGNFILYGFSSPPDYRTAYQSAKITIGGNRAQVLVTNKSSDGMTTSQKTLLIKAKNRWFYLSDNKEMPKVYKLLTEFITQGTIILDEAKTPEELHDRFEKLLELFKDF